MARRTKTGCGVYAACGVVSLLVALAVAYGTKTLVVYASTDPKPASVFDVWREPIFWVPGSLVFLMTLGATFLITMAVLSCCCFCKRCCFDDDDDDDKERAPKKKGQYVELEELEEGKHAKRARKKREKWERSQRAAVAKGQKRLGAGELN